MNVGVVAAKLQMQSYGDNYERKRCTSASAYGNPAYPEEARFTEFQQWLPHIVEQMSHSKKSHVTLKLLWEEYRVQVSNPCSLTQYRAKVGKKWR